MSTQNILEIKDVHKKMGKKEILKGINLEVKPGEIFGFLGPNGAGKTTLIKLILGLSPITSGSILIDGVDVTKEFAKAIRSVGGIVEYPSMYSELTGWQNLKQYARIYEGIGDDRIKEVLELTKMSHAMNNKFKTYSLGMKQRLGIAQSLLHEPNLVVLDEPMNGLDPLGIKELREMLVNLVSNNEAAVFVSSHLLSEMELLCTRVGIIKEGIIVDSYKLKGNENVEDSYVARIEVDHIEEASEVIRLAYPMNKLKVEHNYLYINTPKEEVSSIVRTLVKSDISIASVARAEKTLEERFLEST